MLIKRENNDPGITVSRRPLLSFYKAANQRKEEFKGGGAKMAPFRYFLDWGVSSKPSKTKTKKDEAFYLSHAKLTPAVNPQPYIHSTHITWKGRSETGWKNNDVYKGGLLWTESRRATPEDSNNKHMEFAMSSSAYINVINYKQEETCCWFCDVPTFHTLEKNTNLI